MLYYTAGYCSNKTHWMLIKIKKYSGSILPSSTYGITLGVNYKNFDFSVDGYGTSEQKCTMVRKHNVFRRKYRRICSTDFWTVNNTSASNPAPFNQVPVASTYLEWRFLQSK
jgi:hypothetical protein